MSYVVLNGRMILNGEMERMWAILSTISAFIWRWWEKPWNSSVWYLDQVLNLGPRNYEAAVLVTKLQYSLC